MNKNEIFYMMRILNDEKLTLKQQRDNIIEYLEDQLNLENAKQKGSNVKKQYTEAKKFLKNISETRPILKYTDYQYDNCQIFTDSFVLFKMKNHIEGLPYHNNEHGIYPDIREFMPRKENMICITNLFNYTDVLNKCDELKINKIKFPKEKKYLINLNGAYLNPKYVKLVIDILCDNINNIEVYFKGDMRPVLFTNSKGDEAIICPIRIN